MATATTWINPFDKEIQTADWLDYECDQVHKYNEAYRKSHPNR